MRLTILLAVGMVKYLKPYFEEDWGFHDLGFFLIKSLVSFVMVLTCLMFAQCHSLPVRCMLVLTFSTVPDASKT